MLEERPDVHSRAFHAIVVALFATVIFVPWLDVFREAEASGPRAAELRDPAPAPRAPKDLGDLASFPSRFDEHFSDTFGFRDLFLRGHSVVKLFGFGVSPTPRVLVGKEGWLFYTGDRTIEDYRGRTPFTEAELLAWQRMLEARRDFLAERGSEYLLVIVPNKEEVYPELMPDHLRQVGPRRLDQLLDHMRERSDVDVLDLRPAMVAARTDPRFETEPYLKLGTHWNGAGSYAAYEAIVAHLAERFPELAPKPLDAFQRVEIGSNGDSWGRAMYVDDLLRQEIVAYRPEHGASQMTLDTGYNDKSIHVFKSDAAPPVRAMFFHDSFGPYHYHLLSTAFSRLACHWRSDFPVESVVEEAPDVVIEEFVQRWLVNMHPDDGPRRPIDEAAFARLERPLLSVQLPRGAKRLEAVGDCEVVEEPGEEGGVRLRFDGKDDLLRLPEVREVAAGAVLKLDVTASEEGRLRVFVADEGQDLPLRKGGHRVDVPAGRSQIFVPLTERALRGRLFLRTLVHPESIVLHSIEVRAPAAP